MRNWVGYARTTAIWQFTQSLLLCRDCGWLGTTDKGLACHVRIGHDKEPSPSLEFHLKPARQESEDEDGALAKQRAKQRVKDRAKSSDGI